jgi:hypothetical protein
LKEIRAKQDQGEENGSHSRVCQWILNVKGTTEGKAHDTITVWHRQPRHATKSAQQRLGHYSSCQKRRAVFAEISTQLRAIKFCISKTSANIVLLDHSVALAKMLRTFALLT